MDYSLYTNSTHTDVGVPLHFDNGHSLQVKTHQSPHFPELSEIPKSSTNLSSLTITWAESLFRRSNSFCLPSDQYKAPPSSLNSEQDWIFQWLSSTELDSVCPKDPLQFQSEFQSPSSDSHSSSCRN